jgi:CRP/FNR family cyclic AMP-dependent transcriptional regulator
MDQPTFLDRLSPTGRVALESAGTLRRHRRGAMIFREGESSSTVVVILEGSIKLTKVAMDGREVVLALQGAGDVLGELAALDAEPRSATGVFLTPGSLIQLSSDQFNTLVDEEPSVASATLRTVALRLRNASNRQLEFGTSDSMTRVCGRLVELMERGTAAADGSVQFKSPLSQQELASWAGVSRDAVVRALKTARDQGWLETGRQSFVVKSPRDLRRHAKPK